MTAREPGRGDDERFSRVYDAYYRRMVGYFYKVFGVSREDAEDLTQDAFIRFYKKIDKYEGVEEGPLLTKVARNVGLNDVRSANTIKRGSVRPESIDDPDLVREPVDVSQKDPVDTMIQNEQREWLYEALKGLSIGERRCIQLSLEGHTNDEIARILEISVTAVKSRIRDARRALRERLGDERALPED